MSGITEFLLARISEDERSARKLAEVDRRPVLSLATTINHPQRLLAECEAKRAIVTHHARVRDVYGDDAGDTCSICTETGPMPQGWPCATLQTIAAIYADHDDYREEWKTLTQRG